MPIPLKGDRSAYDVKHYPLLHANDFEEGDSHHPQLKAGANADDILYIGDAQEIVFKEQSANMVLAGPEGGYPGAPTFRALIMADLPGELSGGTATDVMALYKDGSRPLEGSLPINDGVALGDALLWNQTNIELLRDFYAGRLDGAHVAFMRHLASGSVYLVFFETTDNDEIPSFSTGAQDIEGTNTAWLRLGREGRPGIRWTGDAATGRMEVDTGCISPMTSEVHSGYSEYAAQGGDPTQPSAGYLRLFAKSVGGVTRPYVVLDNGVVYSLTQPTLTVTEQDGAPAVAVATLKFPNGSVTDNGDGSVSVVFGSGGHTILEETTPLTQRTNLKFTGAGVTASDDAGNDTTIVTIPGASSPDAADVTYTPAVLTDWNSDADPGDVDNALDQLAARVDDLEGTPPGSPDAADVTYTPAVLTDWNSDADPGDVDNALDQLAARVDDLEGTAGHAAITLGTDADTLLGLSGQELSLDTQSANRVFAGPTTGAAADPTFRALVAADVGSGTPDGSKYLRDDMSWQAMAIGHAYAGYNTVGGSQENMTRKVVYFKKLTLSADSFLAGISAYVRHTNDYVMGYAAGVWTDNSDSPDLLLATSGPPSTYNSLLSDSAAAQNKTARWLHVPVNVQLTAGTYWIGFSAIAGDGDTYAQIYYDGSGSDKKHTEGGVWLSDGPRYTVTSTSNRYSLRASVLTTVTPTGGGDAADITYTPGTLADWDGAADPGNTDDALDQLAERTADLEAAPPAHTHAIGDVLTPNTGWTVSNAASTKTLDANNTTLNEIADILGTLIAALKTQGILGA